MLRWIWGLRFGLGLQVRTSGVSNVRPMVRAVTGSRSRYGQATDLVDALHEVLAGGLLNA
jgi:hypothetical protein